MPPPTVPPSPHPVSTLPLLHSALRPFYLCSALTATLAVPLWMLMLLGRWPLAPALAPPWWHAHEMLYGFAAATMTGFLLSSARIWDGLSRLRGVALALLVLLWLGARISAFTGPYALYALLDLALLPLVATLVARMLLRSGHYRNLPLVALVLALATANAVFHLGVLHWLAIPPLQALHGALALVVLVECVMAARVIPGYTMSANPGLRIVARDRLDRASVACTGCALALWVAAPAHWAPLVAVTLALAALGLTLRQWRWRPLLSGRRPVLWILHAAHAWIPLGLALLALGQAGLVGTSAGVHALGLGATGGLIIGMMTRTARGHTGRSARPGALETLAFALVMAAALLRVFPPWLNQEWTMPSLLLAAGAFSLAFTIFLWVFAPWLCAARARGQDG